MLAIILIMNFTIILITLSFAVIPYVTRRTESFGVSIPEEEYYKEDLTAMRKRFVKMSAFVGALSVIIITFLLLLFGEDVPLLSLAVFCEVAALFLIYYYFHKKMKAYKQNASWEDRVSSEIHIGLANYPESIKKIVSPAWFVLYAVIIIATIAGTLYIYPSIPDLFPMHFDIAGNPDRYAEKSIVSAMFLPGMQVFLALIFWLVYIVIIRAKRVMDVENPVESAERSEIFRAAWSRFAIFAGLPLVAAFSYMQFALFGFFSASSATAVVLIMSLILIVWAVILMFKYGQGGSRINTKRAQGTKINIQDDDRYWKLGVLYFNKEDPSLFVEKRFGVGFTINLGRPIVWVIVAAFIAVCVGITAFSMKK
jgi:uncharacterized membrane protein